MRCSKCKKECSLVSNSKDERAYYSCCKVEVEYLEPVKEVCEWEYDKVSNSFIDKSGHIGALGYTSFEVDDWKHCPYCGKEIKIK